MRYIALLRAINVGGNRIVKMEDLRRFLSESGLENVVTYIQSGNAVFDSTARKAETLARKLEVHFKASVGFEIPTTLRTEAELAALVAALPQPAEDEKLLINFLGGEPHPDAAERLKALEQEGLTILLRPRELILSMRKGLEDKRLNSPAWLEKQLGVWGTGRNENTVRKLLELAKKSA